MYLKQRGPAWLHALTERAADFFFPWGTYCICCGNFIDGSRTYCLCDHCVRKIGWGHVEIPPESLLDNQFTGPAAERLRERMCQTEAGGGLPVDSVRACMKYGLYERRLIFELKYNGHTYVARILARMVYDRIASDPDPAAADLLKADYIVPVPVHRERLQQRGFNQTEKIADHLSDLTGVPVLKDGLVRHASTAAQRSVAGQDRLANLEGAFGPGCGSMEGLGRRIAGKRLILLDDIFTTGATAIHCGMILKDAGAARVDALTIAAGNDHAAGFFDAQVQSESSITRHREHREKTF